jgi:hypothetical protein
MKISGTLRVFYYDVRVFPEEPMTDTFLLNQVYKSLGKNLKNSIGVYVTSGRNVFTITDLHENIVMKTKVKEIEYDLIIDHTSKRLLTQEDFNNMKMSEHSMVSFHF